MVPSGAPVSPCFLVKAVTRLRCCAARLVSLLLRLRLYRDKSLLPDELSQLSTLTSSREASSRGDKLSSAFGLVNLSTFKCSVSVFFITD